MIVRRTEGLPAAPASTRRRSLVAALILPGLVLVGCGSGIDDDHIGTDAVADPDVSGSVVVSGSSTVEPIGNFAREDFIAQNDKVDIIVDGPGTGDGFKLFCAGETDISNASRPIKEAEAETCADNGIEFIELEVAVDGLSVITAESNPLDCLSFVDLYALAGPESEGFRSWSDAQDLADELGSTTQFPDANLVVTAPGAESGTYDTFVELALSPVGEARAEAGEIDEDRAGTARADYAAGPNDNAIIEGVSGDPGGFGWVGFAFADQAEGVKLMPIASEPGGECVAPTVETIQDGSYPISRSLYIYVNKADADDDEALAAFVDFHMAGLTDFVEPADYVPLADDSASIDAWESRTVGTHVQGGHR